MNSFEFFILFSEKWTSYIVPLLIIFPLFCIVTKKISSSWFNSLRFVTMTAFIGYTSILFLYVEGYVLLKDFVYLLFAISIFWITFCSIYKNKQRKVSLLVKNEKGIAKYLFYACFLLYIFLTLFTYKTLGIPIFNENSRLATFTGSGLGFIERLTPILRGYSLFYIVHILISHKALYTRVLFASYLIPVIIFGVLSGSRSSFMLVIMAFWGYKTFYCRDEPKISNYKIFICFFVLISVVTFTINEYGNFSMGILRFAQRIIACGDLYWTSLPNEMWKDVEVENSFNMTFVGLLGPMRLMKDYQIPIGFQLTHLVNPGYDLSTGPVALFPLFSLICYGYVGGLFMCFIQALLASKILSMSFVYSNSLIISALCFYVYTTSVTFLGDIKNALGSLFDMAFGITVFLFIAVGAAVVCNLKNRVNVI